MSNHDADRFRPIRRNRQWHLDLFALSVLSLAVLVLVLEFHEHTSPVRLVLGFTFLLLAPGYAITSLLFPGSDDIDPPERLVLSLGLSIIAAPLLGLALNYTSWGIQMVSMTVGLVSLTLVALIAALLRRRRHESMGRSTLVLGRRPWSIVGTLALIGAGVAAIASSVDTASPTSSATEFYLSDTTGRQGSFPTALVAGQSFTADLGATNHEGRPLSFRIYVPFANTSVEVPELEDGASWHGSIELAAPEGNGPTLLAFELYRANDVEPYRSIHFSVVLGNSYAPVPGHIDGSASHPHLHLKRGMS